MKPKIICIFFCLLVTIIQAGQFYDSHGNTVQKFTTIMQSISQKITLEIINQSATRSGSSLLPSDFSKKIVEELKKEIALITANKNPDQLSQEEKDIIAMLQAYMQQLELQINT